MSKIMRSIVCFVVVVSAFSLSGCGHKNPLLRPDRVAYMRNYLFFESLGVCPGYYAGVLSADKTKGLKEKCAVWSKNEWKKYSSAAPASSDGQFARGATLADFRDPVFWKQFYSK